ncbi:predicted oxidoreductase, aryl-alcohol dehydrogenase like protein [Chthonomonas calidirosea]|uniref:Predicted oxidoreductases (Related to aryl-alcohol dehydrogenases) n=1 Tax=Chthonomonas calidirosea (strain DSM 23976 / ICMP 18418 / T49) TaxID=1303518 RepID=S0EV45_CHTCT|nr:aldo/keto reductase [Chthonomonas calidirosea]CCW35591.1 Predicted oxidoreductases (related to aryl-alcohol dehydrogenases) [Chthonomonas calidirosea T49]CEK18813.1 predicted oxidoreductase, aryl-alcohol dehydrogenase like protein [Chthonomonas calidirosea]CEK18819.1 predicted oxidoreductase, aryl-alcohol dehydrogenase like protein [Chthonomonas calidirosea]CEK19814.1 predicted oxidoreductase, aryl-alcohol dehydrogenase like protein [Chthonomonas calidirosea]
MQYVNLGRTALKVSRLCLGTMNFGPLTSEQDSYAIMDRALELGINFFDTANVYGWKKGEGVTEQIIGRWWAQGGGRRDKVVIATKVYGDMGDWPNTSRLSKLHMRKALDDSLRRLKTDFIDLYQFHHVWREATWDEIWEFCEWAHAAGKVLYFGSSNFAGWHIVQANEAAKRRNFLGLVSEQSIYHLLRRQIEMEVIPACVAYGVGIIPWSPLGGGLLGGVLQKLSEGRRASEGMQQQVEAHREKLEAWENLCRELGEKPANVAIAWMLQNPAITAPIIGPRTIEQLDDIVRALEIKLDEETNKRIEAIFPGYKTAPEEYAW